MPDAEHRHRKQVYHANKGKKHVDTQDAQTPGQPFTNVNSSHWEDYSAEEKMEDETE